MGKLFRRLLGLETDEEYFERKPEATSRVTAWGATISNPKRIEEVIKREIDRMKK